MAGEKIDGDAELAFATVQMPRSEAPQEPQRIEHVSGGILCGNAEYAFWKSDEPVTPAQNPIVAPKGQRQPT